MAKNQLNNHDIHVAIVKGVLNMTFLLWCDIDLLFYNSQSQAKWSRKNGQGLPAVRGNL
jgi:hypothetical protein